jgi:hypothetical protein
LGLSKPETDCTNVVTINLSFKTVIASVGEAGVSGNMFPACVTVWGLSHIRALQGRQSIVAFNQYRYRLLFS